MIDTTAPLSLLEALVLGIVQGLTEFLPISSTAHLRVVPALLGWDDPGVSVTAAIQLGSVAAVIAYFRRDLTQVLTGISRAVRHGQWRDPDARLGVAMVIGTLPILVLGLGIKFFWHAGYASSPLRSVPSIAIVSIVMALFLAMAECMGPRLKQLGGVTGRDGFVVGLAQALAVIPGVSRSGSTLTASLFDGWNRADAARFSFLLGIPAISIAGLVELKSALSTSAGAGPLPLLVGIFSAALVSWLAIDWLLRFLQRNSTWIFVGYRLVFGAGLLVWWAFKSAN
jgi:undecaprenyl-diphosphatase